LETKGLEIATRALGETRKSARAEPKSPTKSRASSHCGGAPLPFIDHGSIGVQVAVNKPVGFANPAPCGHRREKLPV
jgi:hypothetical protein